MKTKKRKHRRSATFSNSEYQERRHAHRARSCKSHACFQREAPSALLDHSVCVSQKDGAIGLIYRVSAPTTGFAAKSVPLPGCRAKAANVVGIKVGAIGRIHQVSTPNAAKSIPFCRCPGKVVDTQKRHQEDKKTNSVPPETTYGGTKVREAEIRRTSHFSANSAQEQLEISTRHKRRPFQHVLGPVNAQCALRVGHVEKHPCSRVRNMYMYILKYTKVVGTAKCATQSLHTLKSLGERFQKVCKHRIQS